MYPIHVINLTRSSDRMDRFARLNASLMTHIRRFAAIDGAEIDRNDPKVASIVAPDVPYTSGAVGCAMSHAALWDRAISDGRPIVICEDDAVFNEHFPRHLEAFTNLKNFEWDIILWGWNFDAVLLFNMLPGCSPCFAQFDQEQLRRNLSRFTSLRYTCNIFPLMMASGTVCYAVSPKGARRLKELCLPIRTAQVNLARLDGTVANGGLDITLSSLYPKLKSFVCFPPLVVTENDLQTSTVQRDAAGA